MALQLRFCSHSRSFSVISLDLHFAASTAMMMMMVFLYVIVVYRMHECKMRKTEEEMENEKAMDLCLRFTVFQVSIVVWFYFIFSC